MVYQIKCKNKKACPLRFKRNRGFTLVELIVVISIFAIFFAISESVYVNFKSSGNLKIGTSSVVQALRYAEGNSISIKDDSKWGIYVSSGKLLIFKGDSFASRDVSADQTVDLPSGVTSTGLSEIVFDTMTGFTTNTGTIIISNSYGTNNISINEKGTLTY